MSAARKLKIMDGVSVMAGVQQKSLTMNGEPIDITDDEDGGWRTLDSDVSLRSVDISVEGVTKDTVLRAAILAASPSLLLTDISVVFPNGDTVTGDFFLTNVEEGGPHGDALKFSASFQSSGEMLYVAA